MSHNIFLQYNSAKNSNFNNTTGTEGVIDHSLLIMWKFYCFCSWSLPLGLQTKELRSLTSSVGNYNFYIINHSIYIVVFLFFSGYYPETLWSLLSRIALRYFSLAELHPLRLALTFGISLKLFLTVYICQSRTSSPRTAL